MHVANGDAQVANFDTYSTRASLADERAGKVAGQTVGGITSEAAGAWCSSMYSHVTARADLSAVGFAIESGQAVSSSQSIEWAKQGVRLVVHCTACGAGLAGCDAGRSWVCVVVGLSASSAAAG